MKLHIIPSFNNLEEYKKLRLNFEYNDFFNPTILDDPLELKKRIDTYKALNMKGNTLHGVFYNINLDSLDPKIKKISQERAEESIRIAKELSCEGVVFHTNYIEWIKSGLYRDRWVKENREFYLYLINKYQDINIYIENMFDDSPYMLKRLVEACGSERIRVCLDVAHANISNTSIKTWFDVLSGYIKHIHINDNDSLNDSHLALGDGVINYEYVFSLINRLKSKPSVLIEVDGLDKINRSLGYLKEHGLWK